MARASLATHNQLEQTAGCELHSLWHGLGSPVEHIPSQDAPDQGKLSLLPAQLLHGLHRLLVIPESHVILPLFDLQHSRDMVQFYSSHEIKNSSTIRNVKKKKKKSYRVKTK